MTAGDDVVVLGAGGHAKVVIATLLAAGHRVDAVYDDDARTWKQEVGGVPVRGPIEDGARLGGSRAVIAIGDNASRKKTAERCRELEWVNVIHPAATVHESVVIGAGTVVFAGAVIQPDVVLGTHCIVNTAASIDHDCRGGDFVHVAPGAHLAGDVLLGDGVLVGMGSALMPGVAVGDWSAVGAGAVVTGDVPAETVAVGLPARTMNPADRRG